MMPRAQEQALRAAAWNVVAYLEGLVIRDSTRTVAAQLHQALVHALDPRSFDPPPPVVASGQQKVCRGPKCRTADGEGTPRAVEIFDRDAGAKDGRQGWCRPCMAAYRKQWRRDQAQRRHGAPA